MEERSDISGVRRQGRRTRRDRGTTFIELLVSVVILGTAGIAVLTAIAATVRATTVHDRVATAQAQLADAGDILTDVTYSGGDPHYVDCATPADYDFRLANDWPTQAASWPDVTVIDVQFWDGIDDWDPLASCTTPNGAMQKITLQATIDGHTRQLTVVKRQGTEAVGPGGAWDDDMVAPTPNPGF